MAPLAAKWELLPWLCAARPASLGSASHLPSSTILSEALEVMGNCTRLFV